MLYAKAKEIYDSGKLGEVFSINAYWDGTSAWRYIGAGRAPCALGADSTRVARAIPTPGTVAGSPAPSSSPLSSSRM